MAGATPVDVVSRYPDGGGIVRALGVSINVGRGGGVSSLSDWGMTDALVAAGVLVRHEWHGSGLEGHDTYSLAVLPDGWTRS